MGPRPKSHARGVVSGKFPPKLLTNGSPSSRVNTNPTDYHCCRSVNAKPQRPAHCYLFPSRNHGTTDFLACLSCSQ